MQNALGERLTQVLNYYSVNESELSRLVGISKQNINNIINNGNPTFRTIASVIKHFTSVNARWFITGEGTMLDQESNIVSEPNVGYNRPVELIEKMWLEDRRELFKLREMNQRLSQELITLKTDAQKKEAC